MVLPRSLTYSLPTLKHRAQYAPNPTSKALYDESSADLSIANHLAFWTGNDCERMLRIMLTSALYRDKWEQRDGYLRGTIFKSGGARQKTFAGPTRNKPVAALSQTAPPPPGEAQPQAAMAGTTLTVEGLAAGAPPIPDSVQYAPANTAKGTFIAANGLMDIFAGCTYVQDVHQVMTPDGIGLDQKRFEAQYNAGRTFAHTPAGEKPSKSAWEAFTESGVCDFPKVRGMYFGAAARAPFGAPSRCATGRSGLTHGCRLTSVPPLQ